jgi:hypothetical protein
MLIMQYGELRLATVRTLSPGDLYAILPLQTTTARDGFTEYISFCLSLRGFAEPG